MCRRIAQFMWFLNMLLDGSRLQSIFIESVWYLQPCLHVANSSFICIMNSSSTVLSCRVTQHSIPPLLDQHAVSALMYEHKAAGASFDNLVHN
jgi:hypothetical protein